MISYNGDFYMNLAINPECVDIFFGDKDDGVVFDDGYLIGITKNGISLYAGINLNFGMDLSTGLEQLIIDGVDILC